MKKLPLFILVAAFSAFLAAKDLRSTMHRDLPTSRTLDQLDATDFYDDMESGFLGELKKVSPDHFVFNVQQNKMYGPQGTIQVWFYGMADLRNVKLSEGDRIHMAIHWPCGLTHVRPVYSYDESNWKLVPDGWGRNGDLFRFDVPVTPGESRVYFAAHYPYPPSRVLERAMELSKRPYVRSIAVLGRTERERPILLLQITDPKTADAQKRKVLLTTGDHAGETASIWGMEGSIDFLLSEDPGARALRKEVLFYVVPMLNVDGFALGLDRRQATGVNIYFDYRNFESREARLIWNLVTKWRPAVWLDYHSWHLGLAEGMYGPHPKYVGKENAARVEPLLQAINQYFPINHRGPDTLDSPNTQALLQYGIPGFCPEFNFGVGADGKWKSIADQKRLGEKILLGLADYLKKHG